MSEPPRLARAQLAATARMLARSTLNSLRRRQGTGAVVILPVVGAFLVVELARFGARSADGMRRVLAHTPPPRALHYGAFWLLVLLVALTAVKYARVVPGRGARKLFDTPFLRALPVSHATRFTAEVLAATLSGAGALGMLMVPTLWGMARHAHGHWVSVVVTVTVTLASNVLTALVAVALHEAWSRRLAGRALDAARVVAAVVGVGALGLFTGAGPLGAGLARTLQTRTHVPAWSAWLPTRPVVRWVLEGASADAVARTVALAAVPAGLSLAVFAWRAARPAELSLDAPWEPWGARRWEARLAPWRAELRALLRQAPYLVLAAPAFLTFFAVLAWDARAATGAELPLITLMGLAGWATVVMGTALAGAASRRWRRVLLVPLAQGQHPRASVRAVALANLCLTAPLALTPLALLLRPAGPPWWWYARMVSGLVAALGVGQWLQAAALFARIDPSPDRLTGLSVGSLLVVLAATLPTAAMAVMYSAVSAGPWLAALALLALGAWSLERAATERVRWLLDPDGDPEAHRRAWPALRQFGVALAGQVLALELCTGLLRTSAATALAAAYGAFVALLAPASWRAWRGEDVVARWTRRRALLVGAPLGVVNVVVTVAAMRLWRGPHAAPASGTAAALAAATGPARALLAVTAALAAPAVEELFFRGWLQHALARDLPPRAAPWAFALSAAVFALMHAGEPLAPVLASGLAAGALMRASGRLAAPLAFHVTSNTLSVALSLGWLRGPL